MDLNQYLPSLVTDALSHPPQSLARRKCLTQIIKAISSSGKLWYERSPYYEDALQKTWQHLCENLHKYDPSQASLITWLNQYLKWRLLDIHRERQREEERRQKYQSESIVSGELFLSNGSNEWANNDTEAEIILASLKVWVTEDREGTLVKTHVRERPEVNCQALILRRLQPEITWQAMGDEFQISDKTLSSFYQRNCIPILRKFIAERI